MGVVRNIAIFFVALGCIAFGAAIWNIKFFEGNVELFAYTESNLYCMMGIFLLLLGIFFMLNDKLSTHKT